MTAARPSLLAHLLFFGACVIVALAYWRATRPAPTEGEHDPEKPSDRYVRELRQRQRERAAALAAANRRRA